MRIVIDMQGLQSTGSRSRGIGRYTLSFVEGIVRNRGDHEVLLVLNGLFADTVVPIRAHFQTLLPQDNILVWRAPAGVNILPGSVAFANEANDWLRTVMEITREAYLASLSPDLIHVTSYIEGFDDNAVTSLNRIIANVPTTISLFDLIPYTNKSVYFKDPRAEAWYEEKAQGLKKADLLLSISEFSRSQAIKHLGIPASKVINMSGDVSDFFCDLDVAPSAEAAIRSKYGLRKGFILYTGGLDPRKNIDGLLRAFAKLHYKQRAANPLVIVCSINSTQREMYEAKCDHLGLNAGQVIFTGFVATEDLRLLYNLCTIFVFPAFDEGFGMPVLEAMRCGAPIIGSNRGSIPELIGSKEALFDPSDENALTTIMSRALFDREFRVRLVGNGKTQAAKFSWDRTAAVAIASFEGLIATSTDKTETGASTKAHPNVFDQFLTSGERHLEAMTDQATEDVFDGYLADAALTNDRQSMDEHLHLEYPETKFLTTGPHRAVLHLVDQYSQVLETTASEIERLQTHNEWVDKEWSASKEQLSEKESEIKRVQAHNEWIDKEWSASKEQLSAKESEAEYLQRYNVRLKEEVEAIYRSYSWRLMSPMRIALRAMQEIVRLSVFFLRALCSAPKKLTHWILANAVVFVLGHQSLMRRAEKWLARYPRIREQLYLFSKTRGIVPTQAVALTAGSSLKGDGQLFASDTPAKNRSADGVYGMQLTPRALRIYVDLKAARKTCTKSRAG